MNTILDFATAEIVVKKSKFICNLSYIKSEDEAKDFIKSIKKKYHDARHNCYAYIVFSENNIIYKSSDDKEPQGSAGLPILDVLKGKDLVNVVCVVTRYFGGTLLGVGGLVRAYSSAASLALDNSSLKEAKFYSLVEINIDLNFVGVVQNFLIKEGLEIISTSITDKAVFRINTETQKTDYFISKIVNITSNKANIEIIDSKIIK